MPLVDEGNSAVKRSFRFCVIGSNGEGFAKTFGFHLIGMKTETRDENLFDALRSLYLKTKVVSFIANAIRMALNQDFCSL